MLHGSELCSDRDDATPPLAICCACMQHSSPRPRLQPTAKLIAAPPVDNLQIEDGIDSWSSPAFVLPDPHTVPDSGSWEVEGVYSSLKHQCCKAARQFACCRKRKLCACFRTRRSWTKSRLRVAHAEPCCTVRPPPPRHRQSRCCERNRPAWRPCQPLPAAAT